MKSHHFSTLLSGNYVRLKCSRNEVRIEHFFFDIIVHVTDVL